MKDLILFTVLSDLYKMCFAGFFLILPERTKNNKDKNMKHKMKLNKKKKQKQTERNEPKNITYNMKKYLFFVFLILINTKKFCLCCRFYLDYHHFLPEFYVTVRHTTQQKKF